MSSTNELVPGTIVINFEESAYYLSPPVYLVIEYEWDYDPWPNDHMQAYLVLMSDAGKVIKDREDRYEKASVFKTCPIVQDILSPCVEL